MAIRLPARGSGFYPDLDARLNRALAEKRIWNLHGLMVLRNGRRVLERYFGGEDRHIAFPPDTPHDLRSCSKSIVNHRRQLRPTRPMDTPYASLTGHRAGVPGLKNDKFYIETTKRVIRIASPMQPESLCICVHPYLIRDKKPVEPTHAGVWHWRTIRYGHYHH
jgi:hypothetical protein